jgi:hypothetical protein
MGWAELTSITAYRGYKSEQNGDFDYSTVDILYRKDQDPNFRKFRTFSQELRLQGSALSDKLDWLIGGYFADEHLKVKDNLSYGNDYSRFANCVVGANLAGQLIASGNPAAVAAGHALVNPLTPTCFNQAVAAGVLPFVGANATALGAFAVRSLVEDGVAGQRAVADALLPLRDVPDPELHVRGVFLEVDRRRVASPVDHADLAGAEGDDGGDKAGKQHFALGSHLHYAGCLDDEHA